MNSVFCLLKKIIDLDTDLIRFSYLKLLAYRLAFSEYYSTVKARTRKLEDEWVDDAGPTALGHSCFRRTTLRDVYELHAMSFGLFI